MEFYTEKTKSNKGIITAAILLTIAILLMITLNFIINTFVGGLIFPIILILPIIFSIVMLYRAILLFMKPLIILNSDCIKYYNVFGYYVCMWDQFDFITYSTEKKIIKLSYNDGRLLASFDLSSISKDQQEILIKELQNYRTLQLN